MEQGLIRALEEGAVLVTATRRLARHLLARHDAARLAAGERCWATPRVLPWSAWAAGRWEDTWPAEPLLSDGVRLALWEDVVSRDAAASGHPVLDVPATARLAREAYDLLSRHEIPFAPDPLAPPEQLALARWVSAYEERRRAGRWMDPASLAGKLTEAVEAGGLAADGAVVLAGFDELAPAHARFIQALAARGCRVTTLPFPRCPSRAHRAAFPDDAAEVRAAARWVRGLLESGAKPGQIGVVCVGLEAYAPRIERIFAEELVPRSVLPGWGHGPLPFDLSYGAPLAREPLVAAAMDLLGIGSGPEPWETWTSLLRSPFWAGESEGLARASLDAELSRQRNPVLRCLDVAARARGTGLTETAAGLEALARAAQAGQGARPPSAWGKAFGEALQACGWSTARGLSSREYQARQAFLEVLAGLRAFDVVAGEVSRTWALDRTRRLCSEPFRAEARGEVVPVLGHLQAAGLAFEHLWVLGLHARAWPPPAAPNPFLPFGLQVEHGVREASPETQLGAARRVLERLLESAPRVVLSHPSTWEGTDVPPSPLVLGVPEGEPTLAAGAGLREALRRAPVRLEAAADSSPPLEEGFLVRRGSELLADQAACPFRAFARHRLAAGGPDVPDQALDALERGVAVHRCLERFWEGVAGSEALAALSPAQLEAAVRRAVEAGLDALDEGRPALAAPVRELEGRRLAALLREWLEVEGARGPFRVVAREERREADVAGLRFRVRVDRVDELDDSCRVLMDYKTGRPRQSSWFEERPQEPQLPLYALACPEAHGIGYGILRRGECAHREVRESGGALQGVPPGLEGVGRWEDLTDLWRHRLGVLAEEVLGGRADVCPLEPQVCRYCELPPLCRVTEGEHEGPGEEDG